jgi:adenylosuccinate synthase
MINHATKLLMMKADVLNDFEQISICTHYQLEDGSLTDRLPYDIVGTPIVPIYKTMPGWNCSLETYRSFDQLPKELLAYIAFIEEEVGVPITLVSTGPDRKQTITK